MAGTITSLEAQDHNPERVNVYLDGTFAFGITALEAARLRKGQALSDAEIAALKDRDSVEMAYERGLRLLAHRARSTAEIRRALAAKKIASTSIDEAISRLLERGYLDDLAFARLWISNRQQFKPHGARALRSELRAKGIDPDVIEQALDGLDTDEAAYRAAVGKARTLQRLDARTFREKLGAFLVRRGFTFETARNVIEQIISERDDLHSTDDDSDAGDWDLMQENIEE